MEIKLKRKHKSIGLPCEFEVPNFTVLTGINGSGKTHLLEAISNTDIAEIKNNNNTIKKIQYIEFNGLNPKIEEASDPKTITEHVKSVWQQYDIQRNAAIRKSQNTVDYVVRRMPDANMQIFIRKAFEKTAKPFDKLTEDDLFDSFDISFLGKNDFFTAQFAPIFKNYHWKLEENNINSYYKEKGMANDKPVYTAEEFVEKFGIPPWEFVNKILEETNIPYEVNSPMGTRKDSSFVFRLIDKNAHFEISSKDLSTGEKILMSLALAIYNTGNELGKPELLLIDEPDAGLHPSMSQKMVKVLNKNIVTENQIPTIITTHSPTTVIASEGISIFQLERGVNTPLKTSIQSAIEILSCEIPFLKISNEQRRQVFVESPYDVQYYERLTNIFSLIETLPSNPVFIPVRTSNGSNCSDVISVVNSLYDNGNNQIYGIIDWDTTNSTHNRVLVLGEGERYAIENYLLDPLIMGLFFIRERKMEINEFESVSISKYSELGALTQNDAQSIINKVLSALELSTSNVAKYKLLNGWELDISSEFNTYQGHDLEELYKTKFPFLKAYHRENVLKIDVLDKIINDYPRYSPLNMFQVLKSIE